MTIYVQHTDAVASQAALSSINKIPETRSEATHGEVNSGTARVAGVKRSTDVHNATKVYRGRKRGVMRYDSRANGANNIEE